MVQGVNCNLAHGGNAHWIFHRLSIIHINETSKQTSPATYEIQEDEAGYYILYNAKRMAIGYDARLDLLNLSLLGDYMRN